MFIQIALIIMYLYVKFNNLIKPLLIFIEDSGDSTLCFNHGIQRLNNSQKWILFDLLWYERSDRPFTGNNYETMADDFIEKLQLKKATLAGSLMESPIA